MPFARFRNDTVISNEGSRQAPLLAFSHKLRLVLRRTLVMSIMVACFGVRAVMPLGRRRLARRFRLRIRARLRLSCGWRGLFRGRAEARNQAQRSR